jgi:hypothetical protein
MSLRPGEKIVKILDEFRGINRFHLGARKGNFPEIFMSDLKKKICYNSIRNNSHVCQILGCRVVAEG